MDERRLKGIEMMPNRSDIPVMTAEIRRLQERVRQLELEAGEDANRQDLLKMIVGMIRPEIKHNEYSNLRQATIYITPAQFNAMAEAVGEKGLDDA